MASIALYYPWMHFQDDEWLKLSLLAWDRIVRLRPREVLDQDGELVRQLRAETDLLQEIAPSRHDLDTVATAFHEIMGDGGPTSGYQAAVALRTANPEMEAVASAELSWSNTGLIDSRPRELLWVYCGGGSKMSHSLRRQLVDSRLAEEVDPGDPWVGLHPTLGQVYMAALADAVARHNALSPVTDSPRMHHAVGALDRLRELLGQPVSPAFEDTRAAYVHLTLRAVLRPERLATVPVSRLVAFRERYAAELTAFRAHLDSLAGELEQIASVENAQVAQAHLQVLYERETKPQLDELRRALRAFGVESTVGALGLKVELGPSTVLAALAQSIGHLTVGTAAVALSVATYIPGRLKARRQQRTGSPVAYLLAAERKLG